jgi:2-hydroxy-6-oxonona-2,4-dienedioate hydrolase
MERVVELPEWQEVLERKPGNRERFLAMDRHEFIEDLERWMAAYATPRASPCLSAGPCWSRS